MTLSVSQPVGLTGDVKRMALLTLQRITGSLLQERLVTETELRRLEAELREACTDRTTAMGTPRVVQASGRKRVTNEGAAYRFVNH